MRAVLEIIGPNGHFCMDLAEIGPYYHDLGGYSPVWPLCLVSKLVIKCILNVYMYLSHLKAFLKKFLLPIVP